MTGPVGNVPGGGFKNNLIGGPGPHPTPASDPNYAQQFHNFQQQLYATNTRNNQMGQNNGPPPGAVGPQGKPVGTSPVGKTNSSLIIKTTTNYQFELK